jgi:hypothetical protein
MVFKRLAHNRPQLCIFLYKIEGLATLYLELLWNCNFYVNITVAPFSSASKYLVAVKPEKDFGIGPK